MVNGPSIRSPRPAHSGTKHLAVYLNDHLAGSTAGLELATYLEAGHFGARTADVAATLRRDIAADRHVLEDLMKQLGVEENRARQATAWLGEKVAELKARWDDPADGPLRLLEIAEALALGIEGKEALWRALASLPDGDPPLVVDYARLIEGARDQRRRIETIRIMAARSSLSSSSEGAPIRKAGPPTASRHTRRVSRLSTLALVQGAYFLATGVWPLVHMRSFEAVTGRKVDKWLVRTVGVLVSTIGATLMTAGAGRAVKRETITLGVGAAAGLAAIDTRYASIGRIAPVYLADAVIEAGLASAWLTLR
jgi:hypothetical protein